MNRELVCKNLSCPAYRPMASMTADEPLHCECGGLLEVALHPIPVVFTGAITARYNDRGLEGSHREGHWAYGRDPETNRPIPRRIETFDDQRNFCREFGVANPKDMPRNLEVAEDGKTVKNTVGLPGCEV